MRRSDLFPKHTLGMNGQLNARRAGQSVLSPQDQLIESAHLNARCSCRPIRHFWHSNQAWKWLSLSSPETYD